MGAGTAGTQLVVQTLDADFPVALSLYPYGHPSDAHSHDNRGVRFTGATSQNYLVRCVRACCLERELATLWSSRTSSSESARAGIGQPTGMDIIYQKMTYILSYLHPGRHTRPPVAVRWRSYRAASDKHD